MPSKIPVFIALVVIAAAVTPATVSAQTVDTGSAEPLPLGHGRVFVYRFGAGGYRIHPTIRLDGQPVERVAPDSYFWLDLLSGQYEIKAAPRTKLIAKIDLRAGEEHYVRIDFNLKRTNLRFESIVVDRDTALRELAHLGYEGIVGIGPRHEQVAIIGDIEGGASVVRRFLESGRSIIVGSNDPDWEGESELLKDWGHLASKKTLANAVKDVDIVFLVGDWLLSAQTLGDLNGLSGKIVVDLTVPWRTGSDGYPEKTVAASTAEELQLRLPDALVVKAFMPFEMWNGNVEPSFENIISAPVASDFKEAKKSAAEYLAGMGLDPVDFGPLRFARQIEAMQAIHLGFGIRDGTEGWGIQLRRDWRSKCHWEQESSELVVDADDLAKLAMIVGQPEVGC
jgi:predicted dinucleotide-binding enzyme